MEKPQSDSEQERVNELEREVQRLRAEVAAHNKVDLSVEEEAVAQGFFQNSRAKSIAIAVAEPGRKPPRFVGTVTTVPSSLTKSLMHVADKAHVHIVYEAGPSGYGWARYLRRQGWDCDVIAPSHINRSAANKRIKTDRRDALLLAKESRAGNLVSILIPDSRDEAIRDLSRSREDALAARLRARQQLKAMLLRHGRNYKGKSSWTRAHERHLATIRFDHPAQDIAFNEYRQAIRDADERLG